MKNAQIKIILQLTKATQNIILQLNEFLTRLKQHLQSMLSDPQLNDTERRWKFPNDDYTVLAIWLLYDPIAHDLFPVDKKKSWAELAQRLSKYVGWVVDSHILRENYTRKSLKKKKKA